MQYYLATTDIEEMIRELSFHSVGYASLFLFILIVLAILTVNKFPQFKKAIFAIIALNVIVTTFILIGSTIYLNMNSYTKGPVHWHADLEVWACGNQLELQNPTSRFSNKIGTPSLHEHNDQRVHLEGVPTDEYDASLQKFFKVTGGELSSNQALVPLTKSDGSYFENEIDGDGPTVNDDIDMSDFIETSDLHTVARLPESGKCGDEAAELQVFRYRTGVNNTYTQSKVSLNENIVMRDESIVPPGDCYIIEFDKPKNYTDKLCKQYGLRDIEKCQEFGVKSDKKEVCDMSDVTPYESEGVEL
jgi:hypothetical protein